MAATVELPFSVFRSKILEEGLMLPCLQFLLHRLLDLKDPGLETKYESGVAQWVAGWHWPHDQSLLK